MGQTDKRNRLVDALRSIKRTGSELQSESKIETGLDRANLYTNQRTRPSLPAPVARWMRSHVQKAQMFVTETIDPLFHDIRSRHLQEMALDETSLNEEQKFANQYFLLSAVLVASTAICSLVYAPLLWIHAPIVLYLQGPMYRDAYKELREKGLTASVVDATINIAAVGFIFMHVP